jgi:GNAT superfamily N-acetyltransferase
VPQQHRRQGYGAYAMQTVLHLADRYRVTLVLNARSFGARVARRTLIAFYTRLGFRPIQLGYVDDYVRFPH